MARLKIGICLESLGLPLRRALQEAQRTGVLGVQVDATGELSPRSLSQTGRRAFLHLLGSHNLELTALGCPMRHGLDTALGQEQRIEHIKKTLALSFDLGPRLVLIQAGHISDDQASAQAGLLTEALLALELYGDRTGTVLALEAGLESGQVLRQFLDRFDTGGLGVNFDPANMLQSGFDPSESARALAGRVVYCQAKDARAASASRGAQEVPLGHGDLDWMQFLSVLEEIDYHGWLSIKRLTGDNRLADVAAGVAFLRRFVGESRE